MSGLTPKGKKTRNYLIALAIILVGLLGFQQGWFGGKKSKDGKVMLTGGGGVQPDLTAAYNTFTGAAGIVLMNGGMEPNEESELYKKYGIKLKIKQMDVVADTRAGLKTGDIDLVYCTTDALSIEMSSGSDLLANNVVQIMQVNQSHGADAIVVRKGIATVNDLKGKVVVYAEGTASHTLLLNVLESAGLQMSDIQVKKVSDGIEAAAAFKNGQCDAALVWAPDDVDCLAAIAGSKVLVSSAIASQIIADGLLVKHDVLVQKREMITKLVKAWLEGNARINANAADKKTAVELFAKGFKFPPDIAAQSADKVYFSTLGDNINFFGLNTTFTGMTGEKMYSRMAVKYSDIGLAKSPAPWRNVSDPSVIQELMKDQDLTADSKQAAGKVVAFKAPTTEMKTQSAQSSKVVKLEFPTASAVLDEDDKVIIDREVKELAQGFANAYIRVEGNTDNTGSASKNKTLSLSRANAVVNYLVAEHKFDRNRFIVVGNGPDKPVAGCEGNADEDQRARNRRTEFQFIWDKETAAAGVQ